MSASSSSSSQRSSSSDGAAKKISLSPLVPEEKRDFFLSFSFCVAGENLGDKTRRRRGLVMRAGGGKEGDTQARRRFSSRTPFPSRYFSVLPPIRRETLLPLPPRKEVSRLDFDRGGEDHLCHFPPFSLSPGFSFPSSSYECRTFTSEKTAERERERPKG